MQKSNYILTFFGSLAIMLLFHVNIKTQMPDQLTEEERTMLDLISNLSENELEQLAHTIEDEVGKMSPEEQAAFWSEVDKEAQRLQPKIESYIQEQDTSSVTQDIEQPTKIQKPKKKPRTKAHQEKTAPVETKQEAKAKIVSAEELLLNIVTIIHTYLATAQAIPDFADELAEWSENDKLKSWRSDLSWSFFKSQIEDLVHKLNKLIERDEQNQLKYLDSVIQEDALYNNLLQLERNLTQYSGNIEEVTLEMDTLSPQSELAMQGLTSALYEAVNMLHIAGAIDSIIAKYAPLAERLKQEESELTERARQEESMTMPYRPVVAAGSPQEPSGFVATPSYAPTPTSTASSRGRIETRTASRRTPGLPPQPTFSKGAQQPPSKSPAKGSPEKTKTSKPSSTQKEKGDKFIDKIGDDYIKDLSKGLDGGIVAIEEGKLGTIKNQALNTRSYNQLTAEVYIPEAISKLRKANDAARTLNLRIKHFKGGLKTKYQQLLQDTINPHKPTLNKVANQINAIRANEASVPNDKAYAYLGGLRKDQVSQELQQKLPRPSSLYILEDHIRDLLKIVS